MDFREILGEFEPPRAVQKTTALPSLPWEDETASGLAAWLRPPAQVSNVERDALVKSLVGEMPKPATPEPAFEKIFATPPASELKDDNLAKNLIVKFADGREVSDPTYDRVNDHWYKGNQIFSGEVLWTGFRGDSWKKHAEESIASAKPTKALTKKWDSPKHRQAIIPLLDKLKGALKFKPSPETNAAWEKLVENCTNYVCGCIHAEAGEESAL